MSRERSSGHAGFTLIEVMIALGILAFGLLTLAAMQLEALRQGTGGWNQTQAAALARDQLEQIRRLPWDQVAPTAGFQPVPWLNDPALPPGQVASVLASATGGVQTRQVYTVSWRVQAVPGDANLRTVDVQVTWAEPNRPNRAVTLSTVRYNGEG